MATLSTWWSENAAVFVLGSLAWTGVAAVVLHMLRSPILRQRLAETAIAGWLLWLVLGFVPRSADGVEAVGPGVLPTVTATALRIEGRPALAGSAWPGMLDHAGVAFMGGMLLAGCYLLVAALLLCRLLHRASPAPAVVTNLLATLPMQSRVPVKVLVSDLAWRPFCCGLLRPRVVLPRALLGLRGCADDTHLRAVLLHELAHITRGDLRGRLLFALAMPLQFWNPLFWRLRRCASDGAELLADEVAAGHLREPARYARSLIDLAELLPAAREGRVAALGVFGPKVRFCQRMTMLIHRRVPLTTRCSRLQIALRSAASVALALVASACWTGPTGETRSAVATPSGGQGQAPMTFFSYENVDVMQVIDTIAKISGANIVVAPDVAGKVSLHLRGVPWRDALDAAVHQVGAGVTELDRGILQVSRSSATPLIQVVAHAVEIENTTPRQVRLEVKFDDGSGAVQMPHMILLDGQQGSMFVGEVDAAGAQTGLVVDASVAGDIATLDVAKHHHGEIAEAHRLTLPVRR